MKQQAIDILKKKIQEHKDSTGYAIGDIRYRTAIEALEWAVEEIQALGDGWIELDIAYPNKGIDVICQDEDGTTHYAFQCQCKQPGCREWRDQVTGGGLMINPKRWRIENHLPLPPKQ